MFEPSEFLWGEWSLILNVNLPLLPSCWGLSFAPGHGVSSQLHQSLPSYWGFSDIGRGVSPHSHSSKALLLGCGISQLLLSHTAAATSSVVQPLLAPELRGSSPITSWKIDGETMETVTDFIFLGCKVTADGDYNQKIKRCLLLGRKAKTNLESILKSRNTTLPTKVHLIEAIVFPVVIYGCELDYIER